MTKPKYPDWLVVDDLLAELPELRREVERAYRKGYLEGFTTAADGASCCEGAAEVIGLHLLKISNLLFDWVEQLDSEPIPRHGDQWKGAPTERDRGLTGILDDMGLTL